MRADLVNRFIQYLVNDYLTNEERRVILDIVPPEYVEKTKAEPIREIVQDMINANKVVNAMEVCHEFLKQNKGGKKLKVDPVYLTELEQSFEVYMTYPEHIETFSHNVHHDYASRKLREYGNELVRNIANEKPLSEIKEELDSISSMLVNDKAVIKEVTNQDIIDSVLVRHDKVKNGQLQLFSMGWNDIQFEDVDFVLVGGRPAMGKTAFLLSSFIENCNLGFKCVFYEVEMSEEQIMRRILAMLTGISVQRIRNGELTDSEISEIKRKSHHKVFQNGKIICGIKTADDIYTEANQHKINGYQLIYVDYVQKLKATKRDKFTSVSYNSNRMKEISQNLKMPVIAGAQLSRDNGKTGNRPILADLRDSGELEQDASVVVFLHRPEYYGQTETETGSPTKDLGEVIVAKNRDGKTGLTEWDIHPVMINWQPKRIEYADNNLNKYATDLPF